MTERTARLINDLARTAFQKARALPVGVERNELRQIALALKALAANESWLSGQSERIVGLETDDPGPR